MMVSQKQQSQPSVPERKLLLAFVAKYTPTLNSQEPQQYISKPLFCVFHLLLQRLIREDQEGEKAICKSPWCSFNLTQSHRFACLFENSLSLFYSTSRGET